MIALGMMLYRYKFLIEMLIFTSLFIRKLPRRNYFWTRELLSAIGLIALSSVWTREMSLIPVLTIGRYLVLFSTVAAAIWFSFDCSAKIALFGGMGGYAAQHLFFNIDSLLNSVLNAEREGLIVFAYFASMAGVLLFVELVFTRKIGRTDYPHMADKKNLILCGIVLVCAVVLSVISGMGSGAVPVSMRIACSLYDCFCCVLALWIQLGVFQMNRMKQEMEIVRQLWHLEKKHMEASKENINLINIKCHDMKHLIAQMTVQGGHATEKELRNIQELIDIYDFSINTGNSTLNLILAEKSLTCRSAGIRLNCIADGEKLTFMEDSDIYSLFGNALDNAISAVQRIPETEKRIITLTIKQALGMLSVCIENYYSGEVVFEDGLPLTAQQDRNYHGFGMKSMRYLVQKYHGELSVRAEGDVFTIHILFPIKKD